MVLYDHNFRVDPVLSPDTKEKEGGGAIIISMET